MALQFVIDISDEDLPFFVNALQRAGERVSGKSAEDVLTAAEKTLADSADQQVPDMVRSRLASVSNLIGMVRDEGWGLSNEDRDRVVSALAYFAEPEDLIPDNIPVLGFLDDAIMIEVVETVLKPEIEAYNDFCLYREQEAQRRGEDVVNLGRQEWMQGRRDELMARMRTRRRSYAPASDFQPRFSFR